MLPACRFARRPYPESKRFQRIPPVPRIDNNVTRILVDRLIIRPLGKFFAIRISKNEIVFPAVVKQQIHRLSRSIDELKMNLQRSRLGKPDHVRVHLHPHLQSVIDRPGYRTERIVFVDFRYGRLGRVLFAGSHERDPPVNSARRGAPGECDHQSGTDGNTKIHCDRLTDDAAGCKPYPMSSESFMRRNIVWEAFRGIVDWAVFFLPNPSSRAGPVSQHHLTDRKPRPAHRRKRGILSVRQTRFRGGDQRLGGKAGNTDLSATPGDSETTVLYTRFHEGIDIRPLQRDADGEPLDIVHSIAAGKVAYANIVPSYSNYGRYHCH